MAVNKGGTKGDKRFPPFVHDNPFRRLFSPPGRFVGPWSYVDGAAWDRILAEFRVERRNDRPGLFGDRWAVVSVKSA